jgi:hypothetical protein
MRVSIYTQDSHAHGSFTAPPDHPLYDFWLWLIDRLWERGEPESGPFISSDDLERFRAEYETERAARGGGDSSGDLADREKVLGMVREAARAARRAHPWWEKVGEVLLLPFFVLFVIVPDLFRTLWIGLTRRSSSGRRD